MTKYIAKNDTVFNFKFYRKGESIEAGAELENNSNFERADGVKPTATTLPDGKKDVSQADEVAIRTRAKELKISNWHLKGVPNLLKEIAEVEAKQAAPSLPDGQNLDDQDDNKQPAPDGDNAGDGNSDK